MTPERMDGRRGDLEFATIPRLLRLSAQRFPELEALVDEGQVLRFPQLASAAQQVTRALLARGIEPGDRVAIWAPNLWEWVVTALGIQGAGAVLVPINTRFKGEEAAYILARSQARILFTINGFLGVDYPRLLAATGAALPMLRAVVVMRGEPADGTLSWSDFLSAAESVSPERAEARALAVVPGDLSDLIFTSGTTGHPKGVMCTHAQSLRAFRDWADIVGLRAGDRYLIVNPFFHTFGYKAGWLACLMMGATAIPQAVFNVDTTLERIGSQRISVLPGPPSLYQTILARQDRSRFDLSTLRLAVTGAAVIPVELIHRMRLELGIQTIITAYGLTEATGVSTMCRIDDDPQTIANTSGRAIPGVSVKVIEPDGKEARRGEPGEIVIRGYSVMKGYFEDLEQTAQAIDAEGWLHTGDIGIMDVQGNIRVTDRKKDMFIVGGFNAYPAEIEQVILKLEGVMQVAVVGVPDERLGEVGVAFIVPRPGVRLESAHIMAFCRENMANYKVPRRVELVDKLPMNASGKVLKYQLRQATRGQDGKVRNP